MWPDRSGPVQIIAEISGNHQGSIEKAKALIRGAAWAGANAVKFSIFTPEEMCWQHHGPLASGPWKGTRLWDLYQQIRTPLDWLPELFIEAQRQNIIAFASVFGPEGLAALEDVDCPCYKIASAEATWLEWIRTVANVGKPVIVSLGMATEAEREEAEQAAGKFAIPMHCVSAYPAPPQAMRLEAIIPGMGLSDHTTGHDAAVIAVARGAKLIEKHLMLRGSKPPDEAFSLDPHQFSQYVKAIRLTERMLHGESETAELPMQAIRRRWVAVEAIPAGEPVRGKIRALRAAGNGFLARTEPEAIAAQDLGAGHVLGYHDLIWLT